MSITSIESPYVPKKEEPDNAHFKSLPTPSLDYRAREVLDEITEAFFGPVEPTEKDREFELLAITDLLTQLIEDEDLKHLIASRRENLVLNTQQNEDGRTDSLELQFWGKQIVYIKNKGTKFQQLFSFEYNPHAKEGQEFKSTSYPTKERPLEYTYLAELFQEGILKTITRRKIEKQALREIKRISKMKKKSY